MKKIIVIGGGFCGARCAKRLSKKFDVTLIDNKPYFEYTPGILRTILEPDHKDKIQVLHKDYLKNGKFIYGEIENVTENNVMIKGKKIPYDYLIVASGSKYASPIKEKGIIPATRAAELAKWHKALEKAKKVLIVGGGLVGVELAAEIVTHYKNKDVTICHSRSELIERNNSYSKKYVERFLKKRGVNILYGERGKKKVKSGLITESGKKIPADMIFMCVGIKSNYEFLEKKFSKTLNKRKQIEVNDFLQVNEKKNIFAGGDITGIDEEKVAQTAEKHADLIVKNIINMESKKPLVKYKKGKRPMLISLGKYDGIFELDGFVFSGIIPAILKWFVEWKTMIKYS